jgi:gliding motility-associated lipoprotein GldJ
MKKIKLFQIATAITLFAVTSCGGGGGQSGVSPTTGWEYNNPDNGGFEVNVSYKQKTGPGLIFVQGGNFSMGRTQEDPVYHSYDNVTRRVTVSSFYIDETEVRNVDYREYLHWIGRVYRDYPDVLKEALPDTLVWRRKMAYNEPYVKYYLRHPAYNNYPVVGVSWEQATNYCKWRTDRVNENQLVNAGVLEMDPNQTGEQSFHTGAYLAGQYEGMVKQNLPSLAPDQEERRVRMSDGILLPEYRLPTEAEWEFAAKALVGNTYDERVFEKRIYPWEGHNVRNPNRGNLGKFMANFRRGRGDMMGVAGSLNDNASITANVKSYWPNDYGLFCMAGNVNEWVFDVYRPTTFEDVHDFRPFRGNVYKELAKDDEGRIAPKDSLGRLKWEKIDEEDAEGRKNYTKADYRDYRDGDFESSIHYNNKSAQDKPQLMYKQDTKHNDVNSLINDRTRVYKGGSWLDRAYWLSPGERRFLNQNEAQVDIGFRCAMDQMGSPSGNMAR